MRINTNELRSMAWQVAALRGQPALPPHLLWRHAAIQQSLTSLSAYFSQDAQQTEDAETSLFQKGSASYSQNVNLNLGPLLKKSSTAATWSGMAAACWKKASLQAKGEYWSAKTELDLVSASAVGSCSAALWKNKKFYPSFSAKAQASLSAASLSFSGRAGTAKMSAAANGKVQAGCLYGKAEAVLNPAEQTLDLQVGAAALRGECSAAFSLFGVTVTMTGSASLLSTEASMTYRHKNREWEFGTSLGFIAGLGFNWKISY